MSHVWVCKGCLLSVGINPDKVTEACIGKGGKHTCEFCGCIQDGSWFSFMCFDSLPLELQQKYHIGIKRDKYIEELDRCFDASDLYTYALELIAELKDKTKELDKIKNRKCGNCYHGCSVVSNFPDRTACMLHGDYNKLNWLCPDWHSSTGE